MPSSGARSGTIPSRSNRGAGNGHVGVRHLTCGHLSPGQPLLRPPGTGHPLYWCDHPDCRCFRRRR
jgi:hypothetical protein